MAEIKDLCLFICKLVVEKYATILLVLFIRFLATTNPSGIANLLGISESNVTEAMAVGANFASTLAAMCGFAYLFVFYNKRKKYKERGKYS